MRPVFENVFSYWRDSGVPIVAPLAEAEIREKLEVAGLCVGEDYINFLAVVGGMADRDMSLDLWSVWPLDLVLEENRILRGDGVYFADWLINSHLHLLRREETSRSSVWVDGFDSKGPHRVADSLLEFWTRYLGRDESIGVPFDDERQANQSAQTRPTSRPV